MFNSERYKKIKNFFLSIFPKFGIFLDRYKRVVKYLMAGGISSAVDFFFLFVFFDLLNFRIIYSTSLAYVISFFIGFVLQKFWTFRSQSKNIIFRQMFLYLMIGVINLSINGVLMHLMVEKYNIFYIFAQIISGAVISVNSFLTYKFIIFKEKDDVNYQAEQTEF